MIQLLALDMDGTLLQPDHTTILSKDLGAIEQAVAQDVVFVPASGRLQRFLPPSVVALPWRYAITANGACIYDRKENRLLHHAWLDVAVASSIIKELDAVGAFFEVYANGQSYLDEKKMNELDRYEISAGGVEFLKQKCQVVPSVLELLAELDGVEKLYIPYIPDGKKELIYQMLQQYDVLIVSSDVTNLEVNHRSANKGDAITWLCQHLNIPLQNVMAVGDNVNDVTMLQAVGLGVAMGNATAEIQQIADAVTGSNLENGVAQAIMTHILKRT